jgi:hypothetical protein
MTTASRDLEILVAKIQKLLAPNAEVLHDVKLRGRKSNRMRQIDVLVRDRVGQYEILIIIDCKDYQRPVSVAPHTVGFVSRDFCHVDLTWRRRKRASTE